VCGHRVKCIYINEDTAYAAEYNIRRKKIHGNWKMSLALIMFPCISDIELCVPVLEGQF